MLARLSFEMPQTVQQQIQSRGYYLFLALARFLEAYGLRFVPPGTVYIASWIQLLREHCSGPARLHFQQIHSLNDGPISLLDASATIKQLLPRALQALKGSPKKIWPLRFYCQMHVLSDIPQSAFSNSLVTFSSWATQPDISAFHRSKMDFFVLLIVSSC